MAKHGQIPWRINISSQNLDGGDLPTSRAPVEDNPGFTQHPLLPYGCPCSVLSQEAGIGSKTLIYVLPFLIYVV